MEAPSFAPLLDAEETSKPARSWPVLGAAALLSVFLVTTVAVEREGFWDGSSFHLVRFLSRAAVPTAVNGTFNAYSNIAPRSCAGQRDGLQWIKPDGDRDIQVFCEGGWVLMQKRTSSSVNFHRDWTSYARGFGDETNFWLGNENLHALTLGGARLRVVLVNAGNNVSYAEYGTFSVAAGGANFEVVFDDYSGNAGDALTYHSGNSFSTWDADHDRCSKNCAESYSGGWWYNCCYQANMNGLYEGRGHVPPQDTGIVWDWNTWKEHPYSIRSCYMWVQPNV